MILVDTNIIIDFWDKSEDSLTKIFEDEEIAICGVVQAELLHGAKDQDEFDFMQDCLSELDFLSLQDDDWLEVGRMNLLLKQHGISVPLQDSIIAYIAIKNNVSLLTRDKHFSLIAKVFSELKLISL